MEEWRKGILGRLGTTLILFELVLSILFLSASRLLGSDYLKGIGVGLVIAWATSALAYLFKKRTEKP
jgi:hypothetical protein